MAFVEGQRQGAGRPRARHQSGQLLVVGLVDGHVADRSVRCLPDEVHGFVLGQCGKDRVDIRGEVEVGPDGQERAWAERGANGVEVVLGEAVPAGGVAEVGLFQE